MKRYTRFPMSAFIVILAMTVGCTAHRLKQFETFAEAGVGYNEAIMALTQEAGKVAIDADSAILIKDRDGHASQELRKAAYVEQTEVLKALLEELRKFQHHSDLLKRYFLVLHSMADSDIKGDFSDATKEIIDNLRELSPSLKTAFIGDKQVKEFMGRATAFTVAVFQQRALEAELKKNGPLIERELDLQHAFLSALAVGIEADLRVLLNIRSYMDLAKPYIGKGKLPKKWSKNRRDILFPVIMMGSVENAKTAAGKLKQAFVALVEERIEPKDFSNLFKDIHAMTNLVELVQDSASE